jgi:prophage regulatory protein
MNTFILRLSTVMARTGLSRNSSYLRFSHGTFPKAISLGACAVGWMNSEIDDWFSRQVEKSRLANSEQLPRILGGA